jgi:hypothetical protein
MFSYYDPLIVVSLILQLGVMVLLLQGAFRKYPLVFAYSLIRLTTSALEVLVSHKYGSQAIFFRQLYYSNRVVLNLVLFLMVTTIIYQLLEGNPRRSMIGKLLMGIVAGGLLLPFLVLSRPFTIHWLNGMSQFLYFGSGIMTLVLWTVLLTSRSRDSQLLKFTMGLGVAMTGAAVSFGLLRWMRSPQVAWMPNLFLQVTHVAGLLIWCWAFRPAKAQTSAPPHAVASH